MRLTPTSFIVLGLVRNAGRVTPYGLKSGVARSVGSFWTVPHSQIYAEPERLARGGLLREDREQPGRRRRSNELADAGRAALDAWIADPQTPAAEMREPALLKVFFGADPAAMAPGQLAPHRRQLALYEGLFDTAAEGGVAAGPLLTLRRGVEHEEAWVRFWESLIEAP